MQSKVRTSCGGPIRARTWESAVLEVRDQIDAFGDAQDHAALDRAVELEAAVGVDLLDRPHVVRPVDQYDDRRGRELPGLELVGVDAEDARVFLGRRQPVDLADDTRKGRPR